MVNKSPTPSELVGDKSKDDKSKNLSPTQPELDETPKETDKTNTVENFDNSGNGVTDNKPVGWDAKAPDGTVVYGPASNVPSENAILSGVVSTAVYANENEFDDKGLKDSEPEPEPEPEPDPEPEVRTTDKTPTK